MVGPPWANQSRKRDWNVIGAFHKEIVFRFSLAQHFPICSGFGASSVRPFLKCPARAGHFYFLGAGHFSGSHFLFPENETFLNCSSQAVKLMSFKVSVPLQKGTVRIFAPCRVGGGGWGRGGGGAGGTHGATCMVIKCSFDCKFPKQLRLIKFPMILTHDFRYT